MTKLTINAPDWLAEAKFPLTSEALLTSWMLRNSLHAATMAQKMLWIDERDLPLEEYRNIMQRYVVLGPTLDICLIKRSCSTD